jgi:hypothetical protein
MLERIDLLLYRLRYVVGGVFVVSALSLLLFVLSTTVMAQDSQNTSTTPNVSSYDGPNAVTGGISVAVVDIEIKANKYGHDLNRNLRAFGGVIADAGSRSGGLIVSGAKTSATFVGHTVGSGFRLVGLGIKNSVLFTVRAVGSSVALMGNTIGTVFGFVSNSPVLSSVIKPASDDEVPAIQPYSATMFASQKDQTAPAANSPKPASPTVATAAHVEEVAAWPLRGDLTTLFGVPHWPYQPTHTGIDISDGQPSGVSGVKPFKPGTVVETVNSFSGLGNHVVIDHGNGLTSVYAHLSSIAVRTGQIVDQGVTLGTEGSTGASTGTHLHFEIRINGQPVNPLPYLN